MDFRSTNEQKARGFTASPITPRAHQLDRFPRSLSAGLGKRSASTPRWPEQRWNADKTRVEG
jgi:hypothetical protein